MKIELLTPSNAPEIAAPQDRVHGLFVDFNNQYHVIRRAWGNRKINVARLIRFFLPGTHKVAFLKAPDLQKVSRFDRVLDSCGFHRAIIYNAPRYVGCSTIMAGMLGAFLERTKSRIDLVTSDIEFDLHFENQVTRYSFAEDQGSPIILPANLLTPIPVESRLEFEDDTGLS